MGYDGMEYGILWDQYCCVLTAKTAVWPQRQTETNMKGRPFVSALSVCDPGVFGLTAYGVASVEVREG